jgi:hypothetical protein
LAAFQGSGNWDSRRQWLNKDAWDIRLEYHQVHKPCSISMNLLIYVCHKALLFPAGCRLQTRTELGILSPPLAHGFRNTGHEMWTDFLNNAQSRWLSRSGDMLFIHVHEQRLVTLVQSFSQAISR